jgi:hypothetical protein
VFPRLGKALAADFAEALSAGAKASGAAAGLTATTGLPDADSAAGSFVVLGILMQTAEARCHSIASDPPRDDFHRRTLARPAPMRPASGGDPIAVELGLAFRELAADLSAMLTAFERTLGAREREEWRLADARRNEVLEYSLRSADTLRFVAEATREIPIPPIAVQPPASSADDLPIEVQAYLFRSYVLPSHVMRFFALATGDSGGRRATFSAIPSSAQELARYLTSWDGRPEGVG